jgi:copper chaperone CopZ
MQTELIKVKGMTCGGCISKITNALRATPGVGEVTVSLAAGEATVNYDDRLTSSNQLKAAVQSAGYGVDAAKPARREQSKGGCCS